MSLDPLSSYPSGMGPSRQERIDLYPQVTAWAQLGSELVYFLVSMGPKFGRTIQLRMGSDLKSGPFLVSMLSWQSAALPRRWATCVSQIDSTVGAPKTSNQTAFYKCFNFVYKKSPCNNRNL